MKVNTDLAKERAKCDFNVEELTHYLDEGADQTRRRKEVENRVLSVKGILDEVPEEYLSHKDKYENAIRKAVLLFKVLKDVQNPGQTEMEKVRSSFRHTVQTAVFKDHSPFSLHTAMFIPGIVGQCDDKQREYWLKRAQNMEIIGTYAQTELSHGTFIRGLETTATYDPATEEFVLHSPKISSYKWWPGNLGHTSNYCIVMAQLYSKGKHCGIQPFMVQLRDENTHEPLPGIKLGEIGVKLGYNTVNNGFLGFEQHRIPRDRMLMKNAQVLKDGTFKAFPNNKLTYGTMVFVRVLILNVMANQLAKAVTIAIRYSAVRRQSQLKPDEPEPQILDYVTQQHKLFIALASSHAFGTVARWFWSMFDNVNKELAAGKLDNLAELHALACCLKVISSADGAAMVERCRLACGGHGYMLASNLPQIYGVVTPASTYEGENTVLLLQTARALVKAWNQAAKGGTVAPTMKYLIENKPQKPWRNDIDGIIEGFRNVAARKLATSVASIESYVKAGNSQENAWNKASVQLIAVSEAHGRVIMMSAFKTEMERNTSSLSAPVRRVLAQLVELYILYWALEKLGDLLLYTRINESDVLELQRRYEELLEKLRPNAVGLVDAFDFRDEILNSALGAYDGRVYERLMAEALKSPLNAKPVDDSFHKYLKPFMQGKL
ncbi:probable peroxisomal acyl-coenzyme A oxidase 1 [Plodia interpunctella]|uniref:probable peroxisomal acyl-coenzyme A oxidase 1 n=1 Tax=Plodia interpunctella TaxID=58824 RepID=UPI002367A672|nr:probable peroxisomal acyl-coenzyme A oxidase 1 [Plodia interpunctella]